MTLLLLCNRYSPLQLNVMVRFRVPQWMIDKMREQMALQRDVSRATHPPVNSAVEKSGTADVASLANSNAHPQVSDAHPQVSDRAGASVKSTGLVC